MPQIIQAVNKLCTSRNFIFLGVYCLLFLGAFLINHYEPVPTLLFVVDFSYKIFCLWVLVVISNQLGSGLLSKQLSNGQTRKSLYKEMILLVLSSSVLFYVLTLILFSSFVLQNEQYSSDFHELMGLPFLGFVSVGFLALIVGLFIKRPMVAIVVGYFLIDLDKLPAMVISKMVSPDLGLVFPYYASTSLIGKGLNSELYEAPDMGLRLLAVLFFIFLFTRLAYNRIMNMDFD